MENKEIVKKLKVLNSMIEEFLDKMDIDAAEDDDEKSSEDKKEDK